MVKWEGPGILRRGVLLPRGNELLGAANWVEQEILSESKGLGRLTRGTQPGVLTSLVGVANWVELRRGTGGTRLVAPGMLTDLLPVFTPGGTVGVLMVGVAMWRVWLEGCSFFKAWHSHTQGILASS